MDIINFLKLYGKLKVIANPQVIKLSGKLGEHQENMSM